MSKEIELQNVSTHNMIADCLTKALPVEAFNRNIMAMGIIAIKGKCET